MIKARCIERSSLDVRSSGDRRKRVDAYFVCYDCPPDDANADRHEWVCKFEVERGAPFQMRDFPTKSAARAEQGYTL